jgi:hypothetical protein
VETAIDNERVKSMKQHMELQMHSKEHGYQQRVTNLEDQVCFIVLNTLYGLTADYLLTN